MLSLPSRLNLEYSGGLGLSFVRNKFPLWNGLQLSALLTFG
jgi:hypothetical protein